MSNLRSSRSHGNHRHDKNHVSPGCKTLVRHTMRLEMPEGYVLRLATLAGLETQTQNAAFFERKRLKRKPWHREKSLNRKKRSQRVF